jgi:hypothetical protein
MFIDKVWHKNIASSNIFPIGSFALPGMKNEKDGK